MCSGGFCTCAACAPPALELANRHKNREQGNICAFKNKIAKSPEKKEKEEESDPRERKRKRRNQQRKEAKKPAEKRDQEISSSEKRRSSLLKQQLLDSRLQVYSQAYDLVITWTPSNSSEAFTTSRARLGLRPLRAGPGYRTSEKGFRASFDFTPRNLSVE